MSLNRSKLDDVSNLKIIDKLVLKLLMSLRLSQEYRAHCNYVTKLLGIFIQPVK